MPDLYEERQFVNTVKAAEIAGVTVRTIYNWMRAGRVDYLRTPTGQVRIDVSSLLLEEPEEFN